MPQSAAVDSASYGVMFDGTTNDTTAFNAARTAAAAAGAVLLLRPGTLIHTGAMTISSPERWVAPWGGVTIKRSAASASNHLLNITAPSFYAEGVTFDGNKAANSNPINLATVNTTCLRAEFRGCTFQNAKTSGGFGSGLVITSLLSNSVSHLLENCEASGNDGHGVAVTDARRVRIVGGRYYSNGQNGLMISNLDTGFVQKDREVEITGTFCYSNTGAGIQIANFLQDNVAANLDYGPSNPEAISVRVHHNFCRANGSYGIAAYGQQVSVTDNDLLDNHDGAQFSVLDGVFKGNLCIGNTTFGCDIGFATGPVVIGNVFKGNQTGLNAASVRALITGNEFEGNTSKAINLEAADGDASFWTADMTFQNVQISNNQIVYPAGAYGVWAAGAVAGLSIINNNFVPDANTEAAAQRALVCIGASNTTRIFGNQLLGSWSQILTTDGSGNVVIPDVLDHAATQSATAVASLKYYSQSLVGATGIAYITVTDGGTGYVSGSTTVTIGGDGSGATAIPFIYKPTGEIIAIRVVTFGTGYSSAPVSIVGAGSGATATAQIGLPLINHRQLKLLALTGQTFTRAGSPTIDNATGGDLAIAAKNSIRLSSRSQIWYAET